MHDNICHVTHNIMDIVKKRAETSTRGSCVSGGASPRNVKYVLVEC